MPQVSDPAAGVKPYLELLRPEDFMQCHRRAERACEHLHPDNVVGLPSDQRLFRLDPLPVDAPQYFDDRDQPVPHAECIIVTSMQTGERQVYPATTRWFPEVIDTDGWCGQRWHGDDRLRQARPTDRYAERPELPDLDVKYDWQQPERSRLRAEFNDAVEVETERLCVQLNQDRRFTSGSGKTSGAEREYHEAIDRLSRTDGLLGELIEFATAAAIKPKRGLATLGAISIIGSLVGRRRATPFQDGGTHIYGMGIDDTGGGKQHVINFVRQSLTFAGAQQLIGPGEVTGGPAMLDWLNETPVGVAVMDEFGSFLSRINNPNASGWEAQTLKIFRELWGINFDLYAGMRWAKRKVDPIWAPAVSIVGLSTPGQLWAGFKVENSEDGTLNRFIFVEEPDVFVESREPKVRLRDMPERLQARLRRLHDPDGSGRCPADAIRGNYRPEPQPLEWGRGAKERWQQFGHDTELRVHDNKPLGAYLNRAAENALRLATIRAIGRTDAHDMRENNTVSVADVDWGIEFMQVTSGRMIEVGSRMLGKIETRNTRLFDALRKLIAAHPGGIKAYELNSKMLRNHGCKSKETAELITTLLAAREIGESEDRKTLYPLKSAAE